MQENLREECCEIVNIEDKEKWNKTIKSFPEYEVFYLNEYVEAFELVEKCEPFLFYYNDGETKAINVFMKKDISKQKEFINKIPENKYFDISSPYGYGGFIIDGENYNKVNEKFIEYCIKNNIVSEFVRFNLFNKNIKYYYGKVENVKPNIVRKLNMPLEEMLMDFEHKVRKNLKRANSNNLKIKLDFNGEYLEEFLKIYYNTMERNSAKKEYYFSKEFFEKLMEMKDNSVIFNVIYNENIISTELVLYDEKNCYSFLGGTLNEYFFVRPNDFLKYEIIKWAYNKRLQNFVLGGGYSNSIDDGILKYKKSFAPKDGMVDFLVGKMIFDIDKYNELLEIRKKDNFEFNNSFFPLYRFN